MAVLMSGKKYIYVADCIPSNSHIFLRICWATDPDASNSQPLAWHFHLSLVLMQIPQPRGVTFSDDLRSDASPGKLQPFLGGKIHTFAANELA